LVGLLRKVMRAHLKLFNRCGPSIRVLLTAVGIIFAAMPVFALEADAEGQGMWPTNGWSRGTPGEMNMDSIQLRKAREFALTGGGSGIITRGGRLVMSWGDPGLLYDLKSTTKSIGITALGLAIQDGKMTLNDKARKHHPGLGKATPGQPVNPWLDEMTIFHLATMTAGFSKSKSYAKLLFAPGTAWSYSDVGANWLAECVTRAYERDLHTVMQERVFRHLGVKNSDLTWRENWYRPRSINGIKSREFGSGISANVGAMARIGYLYLRGGNWRGKQIIPGSFVDMARTTVPGVASLPVVNDTKSRFANAPSHYGLLWWNNADGALASVPKDAYWSYGLHDSFIIVIPSLDIVVARAGSAWQGNRNPNYYKILKPFLQAIVGSVQGDYRR